MRFAFIPNDAIEANAQSRSNFVFIVRVNEEFSVKFDFFFICSTASSNSISTLSQVSIIALVGINLPVFLNLSIFLSINALIPIRGK